MSMFAQSLSFSGSILLPPFSSKAPTRAYTILPKVRRTPILHCGLPNRSRRCRAYGGNGFGSGLRHEEVDPQPFWVAMVRDLLWNVRVLVDFLMEQPNQLKQIEWPAFDHTLKTATLTLVLVAALIVALSSVDAALSYTLALLLRRSA